MDHQIAAALSCTSRCVIDLCAFAPAVALPIGTVEGLVGGWLANGREGRGGRVGKGEWHGCIAKKQKKKKLGVGAKLQRNTV